ncbi:XTP/dITP diphosphatase [soil metagenome]
MSGKVTVGARHALLVATTNRGKLAELRALLASLPVDVVSVDEAGAASLVVVEDGGTFEANATKKALAYSAATMMLTLADDSGLEVDALGGAPGVRSARFASETATDAENNAALLAALAAVAEHHPAELRESGFPARFRCVLALHDPFAPGEREAIVDGRCEGGIVASPRGDGGFGYDPLFLLAGRSITMAELADGEKNTVSHRGQAFRRLVPLLEKRILARDEAIRRIVR